MGNHPHNRAWIPTASVISLCILLELSLTPKTASAKHAVADTSSNARSTAAAPAIFGSNTTATTSNAQSGRAQTSVGTAPSSVAATSASALAAFGKLSAYEQESLAIALNKVGTSIDPEPEGKIVESIDVIALDVIEQRDPAPQFLNWFHVTTQDYIVRREVLIRPGKPYAQQLADESARNLRTFAQFSVVLVYPIRGSAPNKVRILVVTKDVWSLRLSWDPQFRNAGFTSLTLTPAESNLLGTSQIVGATVAFGANTYSIGGTYIIPRIGGSRVTARATAGVVFNCASGDVEGGSGEFIYGQPMYSTRAQWSWLVASKYANAIQRPYSGQTSSLCSSPGPSEAPIVVAESPTDGTAKVVLLPTIFRAESLRTQLGATRSFFTLNKINISFGVEAERVNYTALNGQIEQAHAGTARRVGNCLVPQNHDSCTDPWRSSDYPNYATSDELQLAKDRFATHYQTRGDQRMSPYLQLHAFRTGFFRTLNNATLGLQEDVHLGHNVYLRVYPAVRPLATRTFLGVYASAAYTWQWLDGYVRLGASTLAELATQGNERQAVELTGTQQSDGEIQLHSYVSSPSFALGRLHVATSLVEQAPIYRPRFLGLGSTFRLRGYEGLQFRDQPILFVNNTEFRTKPLSILTTLVGGAVFWDMGHVAPDIQSLEMKHGVGAGLRILIPQLDRQVFRLDLGFPLPGSVQQFTFFAGFYQAFGAPTLEPDSLF
jgi:hypothetical protein